MHSTTLGWRMVNPEMPDEWTVSLGEGAEILADRYGITREQQDEFALNSHRKAAAAWERGAFLDEVVPVADAELERDENIRADTTLEKLGQLKPVFRKDGTVTAGNSSPMNDAASVLLLSADEDGALARIAGRASSAVEPQLYGIGPVEAAGQGARSAPASAGATSRWSSSTRRSPPSRSPAWPSGRSSTPRSSTSTAARSRSGTRSATPARGC